MKRRLKIPRPFTWKQKLLIEETLAAAQSLFKTFLLHDEWDADGDSDWIKMKLRQERSYIRAYNIFHNKTNHIRKPRRKRRTRVSKS